jgi:hypothetical protein
MRKFLLTAGLVVSLMVLFTGLTTVSALTATAPVITDDLANCTINFQISITGVTNDAGGMDLGLGVLTDGNNNVLMSQASGVPVGVTVVPTIPFSGPLPAVLPPGPYTFNLYDTDAVGTILGAPIATGSYDPTNFIASCGPATSTPPSSPDDGSIADWIFTGSDLAVYPGRDSEGNVILNIYGVDADGNGYYLFSISPSDFGDAPDENTELKTVGNVTLYQLTTGELQLNIGPDAEGKVQVIIFDGLPPSVIYGYSYNVNDL